MTDKKEKIQNFIFAGLFGVWVVFNGILLIRHELWRDEANVWLMARDLNPLQLFAEIRYQGHPCLWYLFVMPFAKAGFPFQTIGVLSFFIMSITVGIFLWKAPIHIWTKAICLFSPICTYFYPCIARNYCLIALLLILLGLCFPRRNDKPVLYGLLLGLLVQADTIALAGAGLISLMWLWESCHSSISAHTWKPLKNILKGIWIPLFSLLAWFAQFYRVSDSPEFQISSLGIRELLVEIKNFSCQIVMRLTGKEKTFCLILMLAFLLIGLLMSIRLRNGWPFAVMLGSFFFQVIFSVMVYQLHIWHYISLCFVYIFMLWIWGRKKQEQNPAGNATEIIFGIAEIWLIILAISMFVNWNSQAEASSLDNALHGLYSDGENVATYLENNIATDAVIVSTNVSRTSTVLAYADNYEFYFAGSGQKASYADYNGEQSQRISLDQLLVWARDRFADKREIYVLDTESSCLEAAEELKNCEILYQSGETTARGEEYTLYRVPIR